MCVSIYIYLLNNIYIYIHIIFYSLNGFPNKKTTWYIWPSLSGLVDQFWVPETRPVFPAATFPGSQASLCCRTFFLRMRGSHPPLARRPCRRWRASDAWLVALSSPASANQPSRAPQRLRPIKSERAKLLGAAALIFMRRRPMYPSHDLHQATAFLQLALVANDG